MSDLGEMLRATREKKGMSIAEVAIETRIRGKIIVALEAGDFGQLPPEPFIRGLLKNYARFLSLEPDLVLDFYAIETGLKPAPLPPPETTEPEPPSHSPIRADRPGLPEPPPAFVFSPSATHQVHSNNGNSNNGRVEVPPFLSATTSIPDHMQGAVSGPEPMDAPQPPKPFEQPLVTKEATPFFAETAQPVFQVAPELSKEPVAAHDQLAWMRRINSTKLPEAIAAIAVAVAVFAIAAFGYTRFLVPSSSVHQVAVNVTSAVPTATPQRATTRLPTPVPTFEAANTDANGASSAATKVAATVPGAPLLAIVPGDSQMEIQVSATDSPIWIWIVVDNVEKFKGNLQNETKNWTARERLYIQVKDLPNGGVTFNGKPILARVFAERKLLERSWQMNSSGTPVSIEAVPFLPSSTPFPTQTATSEASRTPTLIPTPSATATPSEPPSPTSTLAPAATATETAGAAPNACLERPAVQC